MSWGSFLPSEGVVIKLAWVLCGQEEDKGLARCSFMGVSPLSSAASFLLDDLKRKKQWGLLMI